MKLLILGATGCIGFELVRQATERGHSVTALVREADRLQSLAGGISILQGDVLSTGTLRDAAAGHDAQSLLVGPVQNRLRSIYDPKICRNREQR